MTAHFIASFKGMQIHKNWEGGARKKGGGTERKKEIKKDKEEHRGATTAGAHAKKTEATLAWSGRGRLLGLEVSLFS